MPTVLITGASRGLGLEFARQYAADGWRVIATARDPRNSPALRKLGGTVQQHRLDVSDLPAIDALATELTGTAIDVMILNAGLNPQPEAPPASGCDYDAWPEAFRVNTMAPLRLSVAFAPHIAASRQKIIAAISSGGATISQAKGGNYIYRSTKAALNLCMAGLAREYQDKGITVVSLAPGWVRTDMGGPQATFSPEEAIGKVRKVIAGLTLRDSGRFISHDGSDAPW
jgi:NAD(P)-dependent dehydrogenase (short-subunit alcohol dehydrogenase family)